MLVLDRKPGQSLTIGDEIKVTLLDSTGSKARIGIDAPRHIAIVRDNAKAAVAPEQPVDPWLVVAKELAMAMAFLSSGVRQPDALHPNTHTTIHVRNSDLERASEAMRLFERTARA